jgi:hypothetical protein
MTRAPERGSVPSSILAKRLQIKELPRPETKGSSQSTVDWLS